jgi:hypothetical protein
LGRLGAGASDFVARFVRVFLAGLDIAATQLLPPGKQQERGLDPRKQHLLVKEHGAASVNVLLSLKLHLRNDATMHVCVCC